MPDAIDLLTYPVVDFHDSSDGDTEIDLSPGSRFIFNGGLFEAKEGNGCTDGCVFKNMDTSCPAVECGRGLIFVKVD